MARLDVALVGLRSRLGHALELISPWIVQEAGVPHVIARCGGADDSDFVNEAAKARDLRHHPGDGNEADLRGAVDIGLRRFAGSKQLEGARSGARAEGARRAS